MTTYVCPSCNNQFRSDIAGIVQCPVCFASVRVEMQPAKGVPWDTHEGGWVPAYVDTVKMALARPEECFECIGNGDGMVRPLMFALVNSFFVALIIAAYQLGFQTFVAGANFALNVQSAVAALDVLSAPLAMLLAVVALLIFVPVATAAGMFASSAIYHVCLMMLGVAHRPFAQTFRVACYATSPQLLQILPIAGGMIAAFWQLALTIIGLKVVHRTSYGRSTLAVFLPLILCCGLIILVGAAVAGTAVAALLASAH